MENLPVHYLQILVAVELKTTPRLEENGKTYAFEGDVSGYYNDPLPLNLRNDKSHKSKFNQTTTQYFFATVNPRLERVLGSTNMHASSKVFVDGDYRFPVEQPSAPAYIEVRNITFNATNRTIQGGNTISGTGASNGIGGGNRRNVMFKSSPAKSIHTPGKAARTGLTPSISSSRPTVTSPTSHHNATVTTGISGDNIEDIDDVFGTTSKSLHQRSLTSDFQTTSEFSMTLDHGNKVDMSFALETFDVDSEVDIPTDEKHPITDLKSTANSSLQNKRKNDNTPIIPETNKRQRKPSAKARERDDNIR
jgi:hypothetical protein